MGYREDRDPRWNSVGAWEWRFSSVTGWVYIRGLHGTVALRSVEASQLIQRLQRCADSPLMQAYVLHRAFWQERGEQAA